MRVDSPQFTVERGGEEMGRVGDSGSASDLGRPAQPVEPTQSIALIRQSYVRCSGAPHRERQRLGVSSLAVLGKTSPGSYSR